MNLKEYGSNIQKLVSNMVNIEDREQRTRYAHILVELMRQIHPNMKDGQDYYNKLWDDLYIMSEFTLDVDSPYPPPGEEALGKAPQTVPYNTHNLRYKHFGHNVNLLVKKATDLEMGDERRAFVSYLFRLLKSFYTTWNKESVEEETIFQALLDLSNGKLRDDVELIRAEGLVESNPRERAGDAVQPQRTGGQQRNNNRTGYSKFAQGGQRPGGNNGRNNGRNAGPNNSGSGRDNNTGGRGNRPTNPGSSPGGRNNPGGSGPNNNRNDFRGNNNRRRR